jgi:elongation factor Ts
LDITTADIKELREMCGAGIMECRHALVEAGGDKQKAAEILKERGCLKAAKKAERVTEQGLVECYIHTGGRIGAMVELNCETDFVARTDVFKQAAHDIAMQIAAMNPQYITSEEVPEGIELEAETACLLSQPFIKDPTRLVKDIIVDVISRTGENVRIGRFVRFEIGLKTPSETE